MGDATVAMGGGEEEGGDGEEEGEDEEDEEAVVVVVEEEAEAEAEAEVEVEESRGREQFAFWSALLAASARRCGMPDRRACQNARGGGVSESGEARTRTFEEQPSKAIHWRMMVVTVSV